MGPNARAEAGRELALKIQEAAEGDKQCLRNCRATRRTATWSPDMHEFHLAEVARAALADYLRLNPVDIEQGLREIGPGCSLTPMDDGQWQVNHSSLGPLPQLGDTILDAISAALRHRDRHLLKEASNA